MIGYCGIVFALAFAFDGHGALVGQSSVVQEQSGAQTVSSDGIGVEGTADPARTRAAIAEVLTRPEFADLQADPNRLGRHLMEWLSALLEGIGSAIRHLPGWMVWTIVAWMILTLLAILAHLVYTLWKVLGGSSRPSGAGSLRSRTQGEILGIRNLEFEAVHSEACRLLASHDWLAATRYFYVAAILWLDRQGAIVFRPSKTNRDYIGELQSQARFQDPFDRLTACFESIVYAGQSATAATSRDMADTVESLLHEHA